MPNVPARPSGANLADAPLDLRDPAELKRWILAVREQAGDAIAAGFDATARMRRRVLSRAEARRKLKAAKNAIDALFRATDRGLFIPPTPRDPSGP
jgi:predicted deacetylase